MTLENNYYKVLSTIEEEGATTFEIELLPDCDVYKGHFPGNPVSPGACNMQMIKELTEKVTRQPLHIASIKQCRLTAIASPQATPRLKVTIGLISSASGFTTTASITAGDTVYITFKGELTA